MSSTGSGVERGRQRAQFETLKQYLTSAEPQVPYREAAEDSGDERRGDHERGAPTAEATTGSALRAEIAETVANPADADEEVRHLLAVVQALA